MKILIFGLLSLGATAGSDAPKDQPCGKLVSRKYANQVNPTGDSTERVNRKTKSGKLFYQGDNVLTRNQAEEHNSGVKADGRYRSKRQAIRDRRRMWGNNRVAFFFDDTASLNVRRAFRNGAKAWRDNTCVDIYEDNCGGVGRRICTRNRFYRQQLCNSV